ncbi:MAG: hypothetical protein V4709_09595 [Pseudomonadota bacterium]
MTAHVRRFSLLLIGALLTTAAGAATRYLVDGDGDQVSDEIDDCPYTHSGVKVDAKGCPLNRDDADLDGVPDDDDDCPYSAAGAVVDVLGCALDGDFDGVADGIDRCLQSGLALPVDARGCAQGEVAQAAVAPRAVAAQPTLPAKPSSVPMPAAAKVPPAPVVVLQTPKSASAAVIVPAPQPPPRPVVAGEPSVAESPEMILRFGRNSGRLGSRDLAVIEGYAKVFARRLVTNPDSRIRLRAFADGGETDVAGLALARLSIVRLALVQRGIAPERIQADSGQLEGGDAGNNRRVEARLESN